MKLMEDLKYTGKVTGVSIGRNTDSFNLKTPYNIVDVNIPIIDEKVRDKNLRLYVQDDVPSTGDLVDIELTESLGIVGDVRCIETSQGKVKVHDYDLLTI